ncbi:MAG: heavy metal translocating P-type ATPase [Candidatus Eremiobacterota bacterium]
MRTTVLHIANMCCPTEEQLIRNRLGRIEGVRQLDFNLLERELTVCHDAPQETILVALDELGLPARPREAAEPARPRWPHLPLAVSGLAAGASEVVAWTSGSETGWPVLALAFLSILTGGRETLHKGWIALANRTLNINFLMTVAVLGAAALGQWPEAAMVTFLFALAERIEEGSLERARNSIRALMQLSPEKALVRSSCCSEWHEVSVEEVQVGQRVQVRPGGRVPLDGVVTAGSSAVDQSPITGESMPVEKAAGDPVFAGTINQNGTFEFEVTANHGNTTLDRIVRSVQQAQTRRAPTQRFVDGFARFYTPAVCAAALLVALVPPLALNLPFFEWVYRALVLLVIACPCALVLSTPITVVSGLAAAARRGILVKGGVYLEHGHRLKAVALDKTGTLTVGRPRVNDLTSLCDRPREQLLRLAASLEAHSEHPIAGAVVASFRQDVGGELLEVREFEALPGRGARGRIDGQLYYVGNHRLAEDNRVCGEHVEKVLFGFEALGQTAVLLTTDVQVLAVLSVGDTVREEAPSAVQALQKRGVHTVILTGDNPTTAQAVARSVGIEEARGNLLPEEKLTVLETLLKNYGTVGMVGDGVNDAPALARSSIGFALGAAGTATALETADVALMDDDLSKLSEFLDLSRWTSRVLAQNIGFAIGIKAVFFALALNGLATLWMAVFADMGGSLIVVLNGLRLLGFRGNGQSPVRPT